MILFCGYFWESREKYILIQKLKNVKNWFPRLWCADFGKSETVVGHILQSEAPSRHLKYGLTGQAAKHVFMDISQTFNHFVSDANKHVEFCQIWHVKLNLYK